MTIQAQKTRLGAALLAERQRQGLTRFDVARQAEVTPHSVLMAERGVASIRMAERLAAALGLKRTAPSQATAR